MGLRPIVHAALHRIGLDVVRYDETRFPERLRARLLAEYAVDVALDVGANDGSFAQSLRASGYEGQIVSFEPLSTGFEALATRCRDDDNWTCMRLALGSTAGRATLNIAANSSSSSLLPMTDLHLQTAPESRYTGLEEVDVARLDDVCEQVAADARRVFLKLDVQGMELDVLDGADRTLDQVVVVQAELSLARLYDGGASFGEVLDRLSSRGFALTALEPVLRHRSDGRLLQVDGTFVRIPATERT